MQKFNYTDERFADVQLLRYRLDGFENLTLRQKLYIYYLVKATLSGRDITTDQFCRYNLRIRRTLEAVYLDFKGNRMTDEFKALEVYLKRVWFSNGIHHHYGCEKFVPGFTEEYFRSVVKEVALNANGKSDSVLPLKKGETIDNLLDELCPVIFHADILKKRVNQKTGDDLVLTSACNYYDGVTQQEAEAFYDAKRAAAPDKESHVSYGLNSKLRKDSSTGEIRMVFMEKLSSMLSIGFQKLPNRQKMSFRRR